eukprot:scaffold2516_cov207-Chaetoceros_neogracile.AAC.3
MHQSSILQRMASTHGGMRNILKQKPSTVQFIKWSVETGVHKDLHEDETFKRGGNRNNRNQRDDRNNRKPKFAKYPIEYEILTLNPPIPEMPRIPKKMQRKEKAALPTDKLVKNYMRRYDARMKASTILTDAEREEYYYRKTLGTSQKGEGSNDVSSAMGRKSAVLTHAYDFALKQFEVMQNNEGLTEQGSISMVEELLANEEKVERLLSREKTTTLVKEKKVAKEIHASHDSSNADAIPPPSSTIPSILHAKPRTIQALSIWGKRFKAVPYSQWTLGASTALDHWIAVDVLGMTEETWNRLLNGELEIDIEQSRGVEVNIGDLARNRDIVSVRSTLFPETMIDMVDDMDDDDDYEDDMMLDEQSEKDATDRSIDELLASLGGFDDIGEDNANSTDDVDSRISKMIDSLQDWRVMNEKAPFKDWDSSAKGEFNKWLGDYISLVAAETDGQIDLEATREALLSEPPRYRDESEAFWSQINDETDAEILLHNLNKQGSTAPTAEESPAEENARKSLESFLNMPYTKQLSQIISLGALRPILDEYSTEEDRVNFMERHGETLLEGMEIEHLVSDPNGIITVDDIGDESLLSKQKIGPNERFSIKMVPYGTDEFGLSRSDKARALYRAWNIQKAGRARYAENLYKTGQMPLKEVE